MRRFLALLAVGGLTALAVGSAAALQVNGGTIQAGIDSTLTCDEAVDVLGWGFEEGDALVHNVRIGGISPNCLDNSLFVRITSGDALFYGSVAVLNGTHVEGGSPGSVTVPFTPRPPEDITQIHITIEGAAG